MISHFKGLVFGDSDDVIGILDGHYIIWDHYFLSERKYLVFFNSNLFFRDHN